MLKKDNSKKSLKLSIERFVHFNCVDCSKWWSIGDAPKLKKKWFCPWCGKEQKI